MNKVRFWTRYRALQDETDFDRDRAAGDTELVQRNRSTLLGHSHHASQYESTSSINIISPQRETSPTPHMTADSFLLPKHNGPHLALGLKYRQYLSGWRTGALLSLITACVVFIFNIVMSLWVWRSPDHKLEDAIGTILQGSCSTVRRFNVWIHLLVNVLSTLLLCASNYCMQILVAPSRAEIDEAHAHRRWLHIGVPSLRNLAFIGRDRLFLWALLVTSSLPLHLLFNSVVFTNLQANNYIVIPTMENWLYGSAYDTSGFLGFTSNNFTTIASQVDVWRPNLTDSIPFGKDAVAPRYKNVTTEECFNLYNTQYNSEVGNVYLIQSNPTVWRNQTIYSLGLNNTGDLTWFLGEVPNSYVRQNANASFPFLSNPNSYPANGWRCPSHRNSTCDAGDEHEIPLDRSKWTPYESPIRYCIVEQVVEVCKLQFSFLIATIVVVSNIVKIVVMGRLLLRFKSHDAIVTLGDALASFLEHSDPSTRGRSLQSRYPIQIEFNGEVSTNSRSRMRTSGPKPVQFRPRRENWSQAPSYSRWFGTYAFYTLGILFGAICIQKSLAGMPSSIAALWRIGFGTVNGNNLLNTSTTLIGGILLANSPQVMLSYLYLAFNALYTSMFLGNEWSSYANAYKTLRVTSPIGQQRDTYWLTVPFRFAIPMTILSGLFHWLASQSLFMVRITVTDASTREISPKQQISTCAFSPLAIILTTITATMIAIGGIMIGRLKYPVGLPVASSCSAAVSASCHPPPEDVDPHLRQVRWGGIAHAEQRRGYTEEIGRCSFSSMPVQKPISGQLYA